jgi:hypothetical protein
MRADMPPQTPAAIATTTSTRSTAALRSAQPAPTTPSPRSGAFRGGRARDPACVDHVRRAAPKTARASASGPAPRDSSVSAQTSRARRAPPSLPAVWRRARVAPKANTLCPPCRRRGWQRSATSAGRVLDRRAAGFGLARGALPAAVVLPGRRSGGVHGACRCSLAVHSAEAATQDDFTGWACSTCRGGFVLIDFSCWACSATGGAVELVFALILNVGLMYLLYRHVRARACLPLSLTAPATTDPGCL